MKSSWLLWTSRGCLFPRTQNCTVPTESESESESESEPYVTTDDQLASLSWNKAPIWDLRPDLYYYQTVAGLLMLGALSDERPGLSFTITAGPLQHNRSLVWVLRDSWPYFTVSDSGLPNLEGQVPEFISPRNSMAQLYPQALDYLFVAFYDSQGYGENIRIHLHTGWSYYGVWVLYYDRRSVGQSVLE
jgi:hypothetical protein